MTDTPTIHYRDDTLTLHTGDAAAVLATLPDRSVDCVVTSPPYYSLRDYGHPAQIGWEATPAAYVAALVAVFAHARRVLTDDGTLWLNLGDTYYNAKGKPHGTDRKHQARRTSALRPVDGPGLGLPRKSLIGIPWRVALALQSTGWTLRADITWRRPTAIPEPTAKDRPWRTTEHIFLLSKSPRYYFDRDGLGGDEDVWTIAPSRDATAGHDAPYPVALPRRCILAGCKPDGVVLDPFSGAGTTGIAAQQTGRRYIGIDLTPDYHAIALRRMQDAPLPLEAS